MPPRNRNDRRALACIAILLVGGAGIGVARTIELTAAAIDRMAVLSEEAPRQSWAAQTVAAGVYANGRLELGAGRSVLIRYALDAIPPGQRITHAEWILPIIQTAPATGARLFVWRVLADWGRGVGHQYRRTLPDEAAPWALPGARGNSSDRATRPTAVARTHGEGELAVIVTEDIELWYRGAAANRGWMLSIEDPGVDIRMPIPLTPNPFTWILRVTYEPL